MSKPNPKQPEPVASNMKAIFKAWAIELRYLPKRPHNFAGRYYFGHSPEDEHAGSDVALFQTRAAARRAHKAMYFADQAIVRRVVVSVAVEGKS